MPKVSIIVPVFNVEKYLDRCVQSLLNQTLKEIEIVLVDDQSPDNCPQLCDEYAIKDSRVKVIHKKNEGLGMARNSGMEVATGEYITFLDSDDYVELDTYEVCYSKACEYDLDICYFKHRRFLNNGTRIEVNKAKKIELYIGKEQTRQLLLDIVGTKPSDHSGIQRSMSVCMALFKLETIKASNCVFVSERDVASEDLLFDMALYPYITNVAILPNVFYNYYINPSSITTTYNEEKYNKLIKLVDAVHNSLEQNYTNVEYKGHYYSQILRIYKTIFKFEARTKTSLSYRKKRIEAICGHERLQEMYKDKLITQYRFVDYLYILAMKYKITMFFIIYYKFK